MGGQRREIWQKIKNGGEKIGFYLLISGIFVLILLAALILAGVSIEIGILSVALGIISIGLGFIALGVATKSDKRHTELMKKLGKDVSLIPTLMNGDTLSPSGKVAAEKTRSEQSKEKAQKRLDEDAENVGYKRGKLFKMEDGNWRIDWGGEFPL